MHNVEIQQFSAFQILRENSFDAFVIVVALIFDFSEFVLFFQS